MESTTAAENGWLVTKKRRAIQHDPGVPIARLPPVDPDIYHFFISTRDRTNGTTADLATESNVAVIPLNDLFPSGFDFQRPFQFTMEGFLLTTAGISVLGIYIRMPVLNGYQKPTHTISGGGAPSIGYWPFAYVLGTSSSPQFFGYAISSLPYSLEFRFEFSNGGVTSYNGEFNMLFSLKPLSFYDHSL
mgnify:CR=1 FL=1